MLKKITAVTTGLALMLVSGIALASPSPDTLLVSGYDADEMAVVYGVFELDEDGNPECTDDDFAAALSDYETSKSGSTVATDAPDCSLTAVSVDRNGKVNHGAVVSTFAKLLKGGHGCLIRLFAQSDYGKKAADDGTVTDAEVQIVLDQSETACNKKKDKVKDDSASDDSVSSDDAASSDDDTSDDDKSDDDDSEGAGKGRENAPGQNKDKSNKGKNKQSDDD